MFKKCLEALAKHQ